MIEIFLLASAITFNSWIDSNGQRHFTNLPLAEVHDDGRLVAPYKYSHDRRARVRRAPRVVQQYSGENSSALPKAFEPKIVTKQGVAAICRQVYSTRKAVRRCIKRRLRK